MHHVGARRSGTGNRRRARKSEGALPLSSSLLLLATLLVVVGLTWLAVTLALLGGVSDHDGSSSTTTTGGVPSGVAQKDANQKMEKTTPQERPSAVAASNAKQDQPNTAKRRKQNRRDTTDYRNIKIDIPDPKDVEEHPGFRKIRQQVEVLVQQKPDVYKGRERLMRMLMEMYINVTLIDDAIWKEVPVWDDIVRAHGSHPVIYGASEENCRNFRQSIAPLDRRVGIAGMFSTGTNLLAILLQHNCAIPEGVSKRGRKRGHGMEWQVPWGKHTPPWYRGKGSAVTNFIGKINPEHVIVAVMVRHPIDWMASMCRHPYTTRWIHTKQNCPNLYDGNNVSARFGLGPSQHDSLAHMWNDWNGAYYNATFPRVMVRFEDVVFFPKETSRKLCNCVGGKLMTPKENDGLFHYVIDSAITGPGHGPSKKRNGMIDAWIKYGKAREPKLRKTDLEFAQRHLDRDIMHALDWAFPRIPEP